MMLSLCLAFVLSCAVTGWIRSYCLAHGIVDRPNHRSSHDRIVARGGGIGFSFIFLAAIVVMALQGSVSPRGAVGFTGGGCIVALTGWTDDRRGLSALSRIICHFAASTWAVLWMGTVPALSFGSITWQWGWFGQFVAITAFAWMINLYNFMDGTDGIAAVEAVTVAALSGLVCALAGMASIGYAYWLLAGSVAGFLFWNWPPARIFMGDAGSGFLGFSFAWLALWCAMNDGRVFAAVAILMSIFVADATTTLLRRIAKGEKWHEPHRSHAYQKLARALGHRPVALGVAAINILVLGPLAWVAWMRPGTGLFLLVATNAALSMFVLRVRDADR